MDRFNPVRGWFTFINSNYSEGLTMARLSYKGYTINLRPLKTDNQWQLELEKSGGEIVHTYTMSPQKTLLSIEQFAFDEIDKKVMEEIKS